MRSARTCTLALIASALWATPARPQDANAGKRRIVPEGGAVQVMLLRQKSVREALKLTDDECRKIDDFATRQWNKALDIEELPADQRAAKYTDLSRENEQFVQEILEPNERQRLRQITLQVAGLLWVTRPRIAERLNLTEEQKDRARQMQKEARRETEELVHSKDAHTRQEKFRELRETSRKRLMELLTDEQENTWKQMTGEPFRGDIVFGIPQKEDAK